MDITVNRAELQKALSECASVVDKHSSQPILQGVLVSATDTVSIAATDLDVTLRRLVAPGMRDIREAGHFVINLETLAEFVRSAPDDSVALKVAQSKLNISSGTAKFVLPILPAEDFPTLPERADLPDRVMTTASVDMATLSSGYASVLYATGDGVQAAPDGTKMPKGALLRATGGVLEFCATDGVRLARASIEIGEGANVGDVTPVKAARAIMKLRDGGPCLITETTNHVFVECEQFAFSYRRQDAPFPDFTNVIPPRTNDGLSLDRKRLIETVRRVLLLAPNDNGIAVDAKEGRFSLRPMKSERGEGSDFMPYDGTGTLALNLSGRYLLQTLEAIETERVTMETSDKHAGMVAIRSVPEDLDGTVESVHCIMSRGAYS